MENKTINVLIVDPNTNDSALLKTALERDNTLIFNIHTAISLTQAKEIIISYAFDVIISSLDLPESQGLDTFYTFKKLCPNIPFISLVSPDDQEIALQAVDIGANDFIFKGTTELPYFKRALFHIVERKKSFQKLKNLDEVKTGFTSMITHELRTPLVAIKGFISLLIHEAPGPINDKQREYLNIVLNNSERLLKMINELLDIAKVEAGAFSVEKKKCSLNNLINKTSCELKSIAGEKNIALIAVMPESDILIEIDEYRISQVITNLINNSLKFSPNNSKITIKVLLSDLSCIPTPAFYEKESIKNGIYALVSITDEGEGIEQDDLLKMFSRFSQVSKLKENREKGTGLGLNISKNIIESHKGVIWVESPGKGKGTTFSFILPQ